MHYIKKLQFQELGSPKSDGSVSRGRYFLISKGTGDFFPPLSETEFNDTIVLPVIPPDTVRKVYCRYVYHNDKFHGSLAQHPRDEYRLYLNSDIDPDRSYFKPEDVVVFSKIDVEHGMSIYQIDVFREGDEKYKELDQLITDSELRGGHALVEGALDYITASGDEIEHLEVIVPDDVKKAVKEKQEEIIQESSEEEDLEDLKGAHLFNSSSFRDFILLGYKNKCAITGESIYYKDLVNLEAAHIKPKSHAGSFLPCNGIAMSRDMHWAFDKGMFSINNDYTITVHEDVENTLLSNYDNKKINIPDEDFFKPEKTFLKYHREHIFGLFKHSGGIRAPQ